MQLTVSHWFYLYIVWFAPLAFVALMAPWRTGPETRAAAAAVPPGRAARRDRVRASAAAAALLAAGSR